MAEVAFLRPLQVPCPAQPTSICRNIDLEQENFLNVSGSVTLTPHVRWSVGRFVGWLIVLSQFSKVQEVTLPCSYQSTFLDYAYKKSSTQSFGGCIITITMHLYDMIFCLFLFHLKCDALRNIQKSLFILVLTVRILRRLCPRSPAAQRSRHTQTQRNIKVKIDFFNLNEL